MKELEFLKVIQKTLSENPYLGDDCAYLKDLGIVVTQDSLVEDIHFLTDFSSPYQIGYKTIIVNLSDILAAGAEPKYCTISLSLPKTIKSDFILEFYNAVKDLSEKFGFEVVGGDITGSEKIFVSACAIGITKNHKISSRKNAKEGDYVITTGNHGSSAAGLWLLQNNFNNYENIKKQHLMPTISSKFSREISEKIKRDYAMMDTSDGLADALFKIAQASDVLISVDFDKIPYDKKIEEIAKFAQIDFKDWVLFGGEDFQLVACLDEKNLKTLNTDYTIIGKVKRKTDKTCLEVDINGEIEKISDLEKTFNHFKR